MKRRTPSRGFTLIELLLVLFIIGVISAIAIPTYLGQRRRARVIGDAQTNTRMIQMMLATRASDSGGIFGPVGTYVYTPTSRPAGTNDIIPSFVPQDNTKMNYTITITNNGVGYTLAVYDPGLSKDVLDSDQTGKMTVKLH